MPLTRLITAVALACALLVSTAPAPAVAEGQDKYGRTWRDDGVLREGCHKYYFRYRVRPGAVMPGNDWYAELRVRNKHGKGMGEVLLDGDIDPKKGRRYVEICDLTTSPGRYTIRGKLSVQDGFNDAVNVWIKRSTFRLRAG